MSSAAPGRNLFILGTDTEVGKTVITMACAQFLKKSGRDVGVMKPFQSAGDDAELLKDAIKSSDDLKTINPYSFSEPLAPGVAAKRAGEEISFEHLTHCFESLQKQHEILLIEGAGGLFVPLGKGKTNLDLIEEWDVPVLLVGRLGLGTLNHCCLTLEVLKHHQINCLGVLLNEVTPAQSIAEATNPSVLREMIAVPFLGVMPHHHDFTSGSLISHMPEDLKKRLLRL